MALANRHHQLIRFTALAIIVVSLVYMANRAGSRIDVTSEGLSRLSPATEELIAGIGEKRPVVVHAFVSADVPRDYYPVRSRLLNVLHEMQANGGPGLTVHIVTPELYSEEAQMAADNFGILPRAAVRRERGAQGKMQVFLGLAFVSGPREEVIPFLDRGLSVEYEIARALRVVTQDAKKLVGILDTDASIMGGFDMKTMRQKRVWRIVAELKKQYEVRSIDPANAIPEDVDVLFVPQLPSLPQPHLDNLKIYLDAGRPALLTVDPMPLFNLGLSPGERRPSPGGSGGMFGGGSGGPPPEPKGDTAGLLRELGVLWRPQSIVYDTYQPHRMFSNLPPQFIFVGQRPDGTEPFSASDEVVKGLTEVVVLYSGELAPLFPGTGASGTGAAGAKGFTPLLSTGKSAGIDPFDAMVQRHPLFGLQGPVPPKKRSPVTGTAHVIAARIQTAGESTEDGEKPSRHVIVIADLDLFSDQFFALHEQGGDADGDGLDDFRFDNVTFLLNAVDSLAGDDRFIALRKRRPVFRRLTTVEDMTLAAQEQRDREIDEANASAEASLKSAQKALDDAVEAIRSQTDLDANTKAIMVQSAQTAESRRLQATQLRIEQDKSRALARTETAHRRKVGEVQDKIRLLAVLLPPLPALFLAAFIFTRRRRRERDTIPASRTRGGQAKSASNASAA